ncbi:sulfotransferase family cytosolic 1B member 1 [Aplysia californica]|uniref:Sulfotransferase family cytosolic 1B member 1 n=1 Tax=Aplysia californica TaxID=6500 RepID=A0ABM0K059_APLCA|nr:sulfotransferase family cytosolic 1B member 1 [Aplysia californica]
MVDNVPITTGSDNPKGMESMSVQKIDGVPYPCCLGSDNMADVFSIIRKLNLRDDDVITVGMPKTGNHWTSEVVSMILRQNLEFSSTQFISHLLDFVGPNVQTSIDQMTSPRNLALHAHMDKLPAQVVEKRLKVIYLLRNPKDVWASGYQMYSTLSYQPLQYTGTWNDYVSIRQRGEFLFDSWFNNVLACERFMADHPECPVFVNSFERMKEEPAAIVRDLCEFLGQPTTLSEKIAEVTQFKHMKEALNDSKMNDLTQEHFQKGKTGIMRKGEVGDWKNWFTEDQSEAFDRLFEEKMADSKLAQIVRPYIM